MGGEGKGVKKVFISSACQDASEKYLSIGQRRSSKLG